MCEAILRLMESNVQRVCETGVYGRIYDVIDILLFDSFCSDSFPLRTHSDSDTHFS